MSASYNSDYLKTTKTDKSKAICEKVEEIVNSNKGFIVLHDGIDDGAIFVNKISANIVSKIVNIMLKEMVEDSDEIFTEGDKE